MRLIELTGYRNHEATKEIQADNSLYGFQAYLRDHGFHKLGKGAYASVWAHPNIDYCIKIFTFDSGYMKFLKLCGQHPGFPHFPKFRGKIMSPIGTGFNAVRMEKLKPLDTDGIHMMNHFLSIYEGEPSDPVFDEAADKILQKQPQLEKAFKLIFSVVSYSDIHAGNIMMRADGTYVITDPFT